ncbi:hypothetical protein Q8A67_001574 [Cirrhinus molitorella]|uniref:Uncharacterized protein n=1 Tax=Cirrhinus molitorella TaxID=172907 RepID=A0AA88U190_9TELE|nr:hypothetical protein Q8A67_001574 [Cirrhinus molitorella]
MRCAREGGGSAWTARAPLVRFLTRLCAAREPRVGARRSSGTRARGDQTGLSESSCFQREKDTIILRRSD